MGGHFLSLPRRYMERISMGVLAHIPMDQHPKTLRTKSAKIDGSMRGGRIATGNTIMDQCHETGPSAHGVHTVHQVHIYTYMSTFSILLLR